MTSRERQDLDRYITGNYGEDSVPDEPVRYRNALDDPNVIEALSERPAEDIALLCCERCGNYGYYNNGSHFSCSVDGCGWSVSGEALDVFLQSATAITLDDYGYEPECDDHA